MVHYIVHGDKDTVGVAAVDLKKGETLTGWNMEQDTTLSMEAADDIPLGHKIALVDIGPGGAVTKYSESIGKASTGIEKGQHVHTHNLKSARW